MPKDRLGRDTSKRWTPEARERQRQRLLSIRDQQTGKLPTANTTNGEVLSGDRGPSDTRARRRLNATTLEALQRAFDQGGQRAINRVMRESPAIFLKMLVLLVPREMQIEHSGAVKEMTDQQIDDAIAAIKVMIADRERAAKTIDVTPSADTPSADKP